LGRETCLQPLEWHDDWPYLLKQDGKVSSLPYMQFEAPQGVTVTKITPQVIADNFDNDKLAVYWQSLRASIFGNIYSLTARKGFLRLYGHESLCSKRTQALLAHRWQSFTFKAITALQFNPINEKQQAGIVNYYNTENWTACFVSYSKQKQSRVLSIWARDAGHITMPLNNNEIIINNNTENIYLKTTVNGISYNYSYSFNNKEWIDIPSNFDSRKLSDDYIVKHNPGFFTGAFVGLYCSDNFNRNVYADFNYFNYTEL
jgi:xylan 1,4-beta-xylosidase